jgi:hypothetical protein
MKKLAKLVLKTIIVTLTVIITLVGISFGASVWMAAEAVDECGGTTNTACIENHLNN